ncbi:MAG: electron transfer flavoprotein subunit alpha/FixB family protein [Hyphomicrobium sp.]|uniref:electron transfer flavoprotein subunit alpha/FixB family protein n=1 Tax=Hyphomicrobium sp. TaxID=82 RepID=UPI003D10C553
MSTIKRVDPRRPFTITPAGLKRIVLGETAQNGAFSESAGVAAHKPAGKPVRLRQAPQRWLMAVAHADRGRIGEAQRQAIAAAALLASPDTGVVAVVLGAIEEDLAPFGADRIVVLPQLDAATFQPEREVAVVSAEIAAFNPAHVFVADTADADGDLGRRLAVAHNAAASAHVVEIDRAHVGVRWPGGGLARAEPPRFVLLEAGAVDTALPFVGMGERVEPSQQTAAAPVTACRDLGITEADATTVALEEADFIVSAGNGVHNVATLEALAGALGAAIGASRVAVDDGKFPRDKQIGATGKTVSASAYVAVGISGAVQHLQGIKDCRYVIAINKDAGAPIVKRADLTLVGDAEELMQAVLTRLSQARAQREVPEAQP